MELWLVPWWWSSIPRDSSGTSGAQDPSDASPHRPVSGDDTPISTMVQEAQSWQGNSSGVLGSTTTACASCKLGLSERRRR